MNDESLSRLFPSHLEDLRRSGLSDETINRADLFSTRNASPLLNLSVGAGLVFPFRDLLTGELLTEDRSDSYACVKLDQAPDPSKRYRLPRGRPNKLYIPPDALGRLRDPRVPLSITEGCKKVLAAWQAGLCVVGVAGVWNWRAKTGVEDADGTSLTGPIPDLDYLPWANRTVYIVFDSDLRQKYGVKLARLRLAQELTQRGARVFAINLPDLPGLAKTGWDDYLLRCSVETFSQLEPLPLSEGPPTWELRDAARREEWIIPAREWVLAPLIAKSTLGFLGGRPKLGKSLLLLDLLLHLFHAKPWLGRYETGWSPRVLYVSREDDEDRLKARLDELETCYGFPPPPPGQLLFLVRKRLRLTNPEHLSWLRHKVFDHGTDLLVLDVFSRTVPDLDLFTPRDWSTALDLLEEINRDWGLTLINLGHTRKPPAGFKPESLTSFELKGPVEMFGAADWMLMLGETATPNRFVLWGESKDADEPLHILLDRSGQGTGEPKHKFAGDVQRAKESGREMGRRNRDTVFRVFQPGDRLQAADVIAKLKGEGVEFSKVTVLKHLHTLAQETPPRLLEQAEGDSLWFHCPGAPPPDLFPHTP